MNTSAYFRVSEVVRNLDFALLLFVGDDRFLLPGPMPAWWSSFAGGPVDTFSPNDDYPFLQNFLVDAKEFWSSSRTGSLSSGIWEYSARDNIPLMLEAHAICCDEDWILMIEDIRSHQSNPTDAIRASRQAQLEMLHDIARRQQIEIELRNARDTALQLERAKSRLLANTSHELRTPLAGVIGMLELASESNVDPQGHLQLAIQAAQRLQRTLNELLNYATMEAQQPQLQLQSFCPTSVVRDLASGFALAAAEKGLELKLDVPDERAIALVSDRIRLQQIISNLVDNAIRYTQSGHVTLSVRSIQQDFCQIVVTDTGSGISDDEQRLIFEPFERGRESENDNGGKGLGLAIVCELVQALGGQIALDSQLGHGSIFTVTLPIDSGENRECSDESSCTTVDLGDASVAPPAKKKRLPLGLRVLIAEDNAVNRTYLAHVLRAAKCQVDEVDNGSDLVQQALQTSYDVILTDCRMPGLGGMEAVKRIRQAEQRSGKHVPIIAITAHSGGATIERFFTCGIDDILHKPVDRNDMMEKINRHLHPNHSNLVR